MEGPAAVAGEAAAGGALSGVEKEKVRGWAGARASSGGRGGASPVRCVLQLREKLALLRREYSETVSRLRVSGPGRAGSDRGRAGGAGAPVPALPGVVSAAGAASGAVPEPRPGRGGGRRSAGAEPRR